MKKYKMTSDGYNKKIQELDKLKKDFRLNEIAMSKSYQSAHFATPLKRFAAAGTPSVITVSAASAARSIAGPSIVSSDAEKFDSTQSASS